MIEKLTFGRTGHNSTRTLFGAAALYSVSQEEADQTMQLISAYGVNHIDTAASYGDSELRMGPWMETHREEVFLASKTGERGYAGAHDEIRRSLERLRTDHLDLIQLHAVLEDAELEQVLGPGGALEAAIEAREAGLVRFIGITSHTLHAPVIHLQALERYDFDSVLLPYNFMLMQNPEFAANFNKLTEVCSARNVAVQCIKTAQRRPYGDRPHNFATWYEPFADQEHIDLAIHWALARPNIFINTAGDIHVLPKVLDAASRFEGWKPTDEAMQALIEAEQAEPLWA